MAWLHPEAAAVPAARCLPCSRQLARQPSEAGSTVQRMAPTGQARCSGLLLTGLGPHAVGKPCSESTCSRRPATSRSAPGIASQRAQARPPADPPGRARSGSTRSRRPATSRNTPGTARWRAGRTSGAPSLRTASWHTPRPTCCGPQIGTPPSGGSTRCARSARRWLRSAAGLGTFGLGLALGAPQQQRQACVPASLDARDAREHALNERRALGGVGLPCLHARPSEARAYLCQAWARVQDTQVDLASIAPVLEAALQAAGAARKGSAGAAGR